jgi:hypothetical protein
MVPVLNPSHPDPVGTGVALALVDLIIEADLRPDTAARRLHRLGYGHGLNQYQARELLQAAADARHERDRFLADPEVLFEAYSDEFLAMSPEGLRALADDEAAAYDVVYGKAIARLAAPAVGLAVAS